MLQGILFYVLPVTYLTTLSAPLLHTRQGQHNEQRREIMADNTSNRGLGSDNMSEEEKRRIQSEGGKASGGNFKRDRKKASQAGKKSSSR